MDRNELKGLLNEILDERRSIDSQEHATHHAFVQTLITKQELRAQRIEKAKQHAIGWGVVMAISGFGYSLWQGFVAFFKSHGGGN